ncbi:DUF2946 domain-containing protein [Denitrificimonas sp. JX-1]|uniref:DUF2946 domain-containing protein n=1 Tax=Denitrificimonas halotolerans TaxID=3098930 RepID=A0ABU5GRF3_9GAMM|nr:DUF2946 domain-containing protein [Denitrificimonas sp. JX-1]MDY7219561.1 DUF2946 domain-containing protein [Denitrificimonas sp. JX-1]
MVKQNPNNAWAVWLGFFAMLLIHIGPLISGIQALQQEYDSFVMSTESKQTADAQHLGEYESVHSLDYHAFMGHRSALEGVPQWIRDLEMCGYCDLLTVNPLLSLVFLCMLAIPPVMHWSTALPRFVRIQAAAHSLHYSRAPPIALFN